MRKGKKFWIKISVASVALIVILTAAAVMVISAQKEKRYHEQMDIAEAAYEDMDYEKMIDAYEEAIELMPKESEAYVALAEYYMEEGEYEEAEEIADKGYRYSGSGRLYSLIIDIEAKIDWLMNYGDEELVWLEEDDNVVLRNETFTEISEFCYQQYVNEYGTATTKYMSAEEGVRVKFGGLNAYAYFKNTDDNKNAVNTVTKKPEKNAKPYKVIVMSPEMLFVGLDNGVGSDMLEKLFRQEGTLTPEDDGYVLTVEYMDCHVLIPTDESGNLIAENAKIELQPMNLVSDWVEEVAVEEEDDVETFELGGETYTYDITSIYIYGKTLEDLSPLKDCKKLQDIVFVNCDIDDLSPLSGCQALVSLDLRFSTGGLDLDCLSNLNNLKYLGFHECRDIDDLSPIMDLDLYVLHPCGSSVSKEQCIEYQEKHPDCEVWFDYYYPIPGW